MLLHPALVHFPIAMLPLAAVAYAADLRRPGDWWKQAAFHLHLGGVIALLVAILSGQWAESQLALTDAADALAGKHELMGWANLWTFGLLALWARLMGNKPAPSTRYLFFGLFLLSLAGLFLSGYWGGELVYQYGAGVRLTVP